MFLAAFGIFCLTIDDLFQMLNIFKQKLKKKNEQMIPADTVTKMGHTILVRTDHGAYTAQYDANTSNVKVEYLSPSIYFMHIEIENLRLLKH